MISDVIEGCNRHQDTVAKTLANNQARGSEADDIIRPSLSQWLMGPFANSNENEIPSENSQREAQGFIIGHKPFRVEGGKLAGGNRRSRTLNPSNPSLLTASHQLETTGRAIARNRSKPMFDIRVSDADVL